MTPSQLNDLLTAQVDQVCLMLLPAGKKAGKHWEAGSVTGESGQSLKVKLVGEKAGNWTDYESGEFGDLIDLWAATKNIELGEAIQEVKDFLGVTEPKWNRSERKYTPAAKPKCGVPKGRVMTWLLEDIRISEAAIQEYQVACKDNEIVYPFKRGRDKGADMPMCLFRSIDGDKNQPTSQNQMPCLFGWQALLKNAREITLCGDPLDALALHTFGYPALAAPGFDIQWIENEYSELDRFDVIYVCMGCSQEARNVARSIIERLGRERCRLVNLPDQTASQCAKNGVPVGLVQQSFRDSVYLDPAELRRARDFHGEIYEAFRPTEETGIQEIQIPWQHKRNDCAFRLNELCILFGINGHGKSQMAGYLTNNALHQGMKACIASMEIKPKITLKNMVKQATAQKLPTVNYIDAVMDWYDDRLWIFNVTRTAKAERILEVFEYAYKRYGIQWFVIDSFMKCGIAEDDYNRQKWFVEALTDFKNEFDVFILLLAHPRKGDDESKPLGKMDLKGTGALSDLADSIFTVWRNKFKETICEKMDNGQPVEPQYADIPDSPDAMMKWLKQRNHDEGKEPTIPLWFDTKNLQYHAGPDAKKFEFVRYMGERAER